jgi:hypothetical protein
VQVDEWLIESLRATVFPAPGTKTNPGTWWRDLVGSEPDSRTVKPATSELIEDGPFGGAQLVLTINPIGVIQWQLGARMPTELSVDIVSAGKLGELLPPFADLVDRWFEKAPAMSRVAFGVVALLPVGGHREGYEKLGGFLRALKVDPSSSELLYRINRPRTSKSNIPDLRINRLSTWHVLKMGAMVSAIGSTSPRVVAEKYACRADLDVNTAPTFQGTFTSEQARAIFRELLELAVEILERGDIE